jgi:hypothetical protein
MNTDRRLIDGGADPFEAELLRSARSDGASATRQRTLAALGLAAGAAAGPAKASAAVGSGKGVSLSVLKALPTAKLLAWLGVGAVGGAVTVAVVHSRAVSSGVVAFAVPSAATATAPSHVGSPLSASHDSVAQAPESERPQALVERPLADALPAPARVRSTAAARQLPPESSRQVETAPPDALAEEVLLLDRARLRLSSSDAVGALEDANAYLARRPTGRLANEARIIQIRAVLLSKGRLGAAPLAQAFLEQNPESPYAPSLRQMFAAK